MDYRRETQRHHDAHTVAHAAKQVAKKLGLRAKAVYRDIMENVAVEIVRRQAAAIRMVMTFGDDSRQLLHGEASTHPEGLPPLEECVGSDPLERAVEADTLTAVSENLQEALEHDPQKTELREIITEFGSEHVVKMRREQNNGSYIISAARAELAARNARCAGA